MATKFEVILEAQLSKTSLSSIQSQLKELTKGTKFDIQADSSSVNNLKNSLADLGNEAQNAKQHTQGLSEIMQKFTTWSIGAAVVNKTKDAIADMVQQVFDLDASLTEFQKVTDLSETELDRFVDKSYETADAVARTGREAVDAATEFSKAGYKDQASDLARIALLYQNIADEQVSTSDATALLVSQMKAFNVEAEDAITIIDQINEVSNNFSVSSSDLATAIPKVSATMAQAGNTMSETIALVTSRNGNNDRTSFQSRKGVMRNSPGCIEICIVLQS